MSRFYSHAANSHFFTGFAAEAQWVMQPGTGWGFEGIGFHAPLPQADQCAEGVPVVRFFNNSATSNNHRFTADATAMQQMRAQGWTQEGVAFCAYGPLQ